MATGAVVARILTQYSDKGSKQAQKDIAKLGKKIDSIGSKATKAFGIATAAAVAFSVKIGTDAVSAAIEDAKSAAVLAKTMQNVTGSTDAAIAATEVYIGKQQMLANVSDTELRTSLSALIVATGDVTKAQYLQQIALDASAGTTKDLGSVTNALVKATKGNFGALTKLGIPLDATAVKAKDVNKVFKEVSETYKGQAKLVGDTDPIKKLNLAYGEVLETLGYALLPVVTEFANKITDEVLPAVQNWINQNKTELADALKNAATLAGKLVTAVFKITKWAIDNKGFVEAMGVAIVGMFAIGKIAAFVEALMLIRAAYMAIAASAGVAAVAGAFATGGVNLVAGAAAIGGYAFLVQTLHNQNVKAKESTKKLTTAVTDQTKQTYGGIYADQYKAQVTAANAKKTLDFNNQMAKSDKARAAAAALAAAKEAAIKKGQALLAKMGIIATTETDPIQLEAARLNLVKQGNLAEAARIAMMGKNLELQLEANKALARYNDLLAALADSKISSEEVLLLSKKWGMTIEATQSYIQTLLAVADQTISDDEITNLAKAWGTSKDQAARYLDFFNYLNDGKLSDAEIAKLQSKWGLTSKEVQIYADLITKASDYVLSDAEITALGKNWGLTTDEVIAYIKKLGQPVTFSGTLIDPATQATLGWKSALDALLAYQAALAGKGYSGSTGSSGSTFVYDPAASPAANAEAKDAAQAAADAAAEAAAATDAATQAALDAATAVETIIAQITATTTAVTTGANLSPKGKQILADEQARLAAVEKQKAQFAAQAEGLAAKYGGYVGSSTIANAATVGTSGSSSGVVVNLVVNGSVSTEQDLVSAVRNGLLATQTNGNSLILQAV